MDATTALSLVAILDSDAKARGEGRGSPHAFSVLAAWAMRGWATPAGATRDRTEQVVALCRDSNRTALDWALDNYGRRR